MVDPMQWWGAISQQFQTIAAQAVEDMQKHAAHKHAAPAVKPAVKTPAKKPAKSSAKSAVKKTAAHKAPVKKAARKTVR
jgi:hypothetical protein